MATYLYRKLGEQFSDANGYPLAGHKMYYYVFNTDTLQDTYDLRTGAAVTNPNPITLDSSGRLPSPVFLGDTYNYTEVLKDANGVTISPWPFANIPKAVETASAASGLQKLYLPWSVITFGPHSLTTNDYGNAYEYDCSAGAITVNLPSAAAIQAGTGFCLKKIDSGNNAVSIVPFGTQTIDAVAGAKSLQRTDAALWITSDGANWQIASASEYFQKTVVRISEINSTPHTISAANAGVGYAYDCTAGDITVNLPSAPTVANGTGYFLKKNEGSVNQVKLYPNGSETIDGGAFSASSPLLIKGHAEGVWLVSDSVNWATLAAGSSSLYAAHTVGQVSMFIGTTVPFGWLEAKGQALSRTSYPKLWAYAAASGNIVSDATWNSSQMYGCFSTGDGSTTFRIPLLQGLFLRSWANDWTGSLDYGRTAGSFQNQALLSHTHTGSTSGQSADHTHSEVKNSGTSGYGEGSPYNVMFGATTAQTGGASSDHVHSFTSNATGGTQNIPQNVALLTCISYI